MFIFSLRLLSHQSKLWSPVEHTCLQVYSKRIVLIFMFSTPFSWELVDVFTSWVEFGNHKKREISIVGEETKLLFLIHRQSGILIISVQWLYTELSNITWESSFFNHLAFGRIRTQQYDLGSRDGYFYGATQESHCYIVDHFVHLPRL